MPDHDKKTPKSLSDGDITTRQANAGRRGFLGLLAVGSAAAAATLNSDAARAQSTDADSGAWTDDAGCGRGGGGLYTGVTDADNGNIQDAGGYGRGAPYC